jgi:hypothetical protein
MHPQTTNVSTPPCSQPLINERFAARSVQGLDLHLVYALVIGPSTAEVVVLEACPWGITGTLTEVA